MSSLIKAQNLSKSFGATHALDGVDLDIRQNQIVGIIGVNGAGKTTLINAILGLAQYDGDLKVMGLNPFIDRDQLMKQVSFISDVAILPKWMTVAQALDFVEGVHPNFNREKALQFLDTASLKMDKKIRQLSKGMTAQLHLALIMAIDAQLLVLDEPTLGLDILYRKKFYSQLLEDYFDEEKTILITTHQIDEIENILTDVIFLEKGRILASESMEDITQNWLVLHADRDHLDAVRDLNPVQEQVVLGKTSFVFKGRDKSELEQFGELSRLSLSDLFVTLMKGN